MALPKTYRAVARLGWTSDTGDRDGALVHTGRLPSRLEIPVGDMLQRPPAFSAVKVGGERLYEKARRGEQVEGEPRPVTVHRAECLWHAEDRAEFEIECSSGTYVRSLISDLGDAYCDELRRTSIGSFRVEDAGREVPLAEALSFLPGVELSGDEARLAGHGVAFPGGRRTTDDGQDAIRLVHERRLVGIAQREGELLKPFIVFPA
jgi:tRNA pseudouridine55 synthase